MTMNVTLKSSLPFSIGSVHIRNSVETLNGARTILKIVTLFSIFQLARGLGSDESNSNFGLKVSVFTLISSTLLFGSVAFLQYRIALRQRNSVSQCFACKKEGSKNAMETAGGILGLSIAVAKLGFGCLVSAWGVVSSVGVLISGTLTHRNFSDANKQVSIIKRLENCNNRLSIITTALFSGILVSGVCAGYFYWIK